MKAQLSQRKIRIVVPALITALATAIFGMCFALSPAGPLEPAAPLHPGGRDQRNPCYHVLMDRHWKFILGDQSGAENPAFDDHTWRVLDVPHDWSIEGTFDKDAPTGGGGGYLPTGIGWYRKQFVLPKAARGQQVSIQFDGVYMNSDVWINGHHLGHRPSGYISFVYDLTPYLMAGKNTIAVRVDNSEQPNSRWYSGSGIYRHVWMNIDPPLHIAQWGTYITTPRVSADSAIISVRTTIHNATSATRITGAMPSPARTAASRATLRSAILDENGNEVAVSSMPISVNPGDSTEFTQQIPLKSPALWSPEQPHLYTLHSVIQSGEKVIDEYNSTFGVRTLAYSAVDGFLLNGKRVKMNGVCLHGDGGCVGVAVPIRIWEERLALLKEMGCNAIRTSHNPEAPEFLDLCDKMGFLVMDEAFDAWESGKVKNDYHLYFDEWSARDVTDQIHRDRNHPSVVIWSAGNEIPDQTRDKGVDLLKGLLAIFHREDPTRPVTTANDDIAADNGSTKLPFLEAEDIVGYNYVDRWHARRELYYGPDHYGHPDWKMIGTESGSVRSPELYSLGNDPRKTLPNYTTGMITAEQLWKFVAVHDYVIGDFMWTGIDYLGEARWPGKGSSSGVIDMTNRPKDAYYFYQSQWTDTPVLHLFPHWNWTGREGQILPVIAYTNCDTVELYLNGKFYGAKSREFPRQGNSGAWNKYARPYVGITTADLHLSWDVPYEPGTITAIGHKNGKQVILAQIRTAGRPATLRVSADTAVIDADGSDVATIHITVLDSAGNVVPDADNLLRFTVSGNGRLLGVDNGNQRDDHAMKLAERNAFNGYAYAVMQSDRTPGSIRLTVEAEGLQPVSIQIKTVLPLKAPLDLEDLR
jgi:beta-galactosidase